MKDKVNIVVVVDVIGALSDDTLLNGNLCLIDDGSDKSTGQGTSELCTAVEPGQTVQWSALAVDLQTPVEIKSITFLGGDDENKTANRAESDTNGGRSHRGGRWTGHGKQTDREQRENGHAHSGQEERTQESESMELDVWAGIVPPVMTPGVPYRYRLELQMYEGSHSTLHIDSPALIRQ